VQLRYATGITGEEYVTQQAWRDANLPHCPLHPQGGCGFARHGTYERLSPPGTLIARWYCRRGHCTFSLLPDSLAARLPGTLAEVEAVVGAAEQASSLEVACADLRLDIELPGVLRWVRRRFVAIHTSLILLKGLLPELFEGCMPTLGAFAERLGITEVLPALRHIAARYLGSLPAPLGFRPLRNGSAGPGGARQHPVGPDPPPALA
jgi:hypothetical protein